MQSRYDSTVFFCCHGEKRPKLIQLALQASYALLFRDTGTFVVVVIAVLCKGSRMQRSRNGVLGATNSYNSQG